MSRPRLLDLFCGAGGASVGYYRAGFEVVGVDIKPQPRYPFEFLQRDALALMETLLVGGDEWFELDDFAAIHASPPCQRFSALSAATRMGESHPDLIGETRRLLRSTYLPYVIENVPRAPLENPVLICGASLGLKIVRHRLFESNAPLVVPPCSHWQGDVASGRLIGHREGGKVLPGRTRPPAFSRNDRAEAMGVGWMRGMEIRQAVPPAYTELIGHQLLAHIRAEAVA